MKLLKEALWDGPIVEMEDQVRALVTVPVDRQVNLQVNRQVHVPVNMQVFLQVTRLVHRQLVNRL